MDHHLPKPYELTSLLDAVAVAAGKIRRAEPVRLAGDETAAVLPVLDQVMFDRTASYLPPDEIDEHMQALAVRGRALVEGLHDLEDEARVEMAADLAHAMAGAAGTFGFLRIADAARRFERAAGDEREGVAEELIVATRATIAVLEERFCGVAG
jgi:HPt (histidine-containing phosphotransfer) domain-containing protein